MIEYPVVMWIVFSSLVGPGNHLPLPVDFFATEKECLARIEPKNASPNPIYHYDCIEYRKG